MGQTDVMQRVSLLELCIASVGVHRGALAASYVVRYAMTMNRLDGRLPTAVEYAEDWVIAERSAWNHRAKMHAALGDDWPDIVEHIAKQMQLKQLGERKAMNVNVPASLAV
jgi:hypothetical protein